MAKQKHTQKKTLSKHLPRVLFAAPRSGGGKTTVVCGVLSQLMKMGLSPVAFKCGPDYIDPMFHRQVLRTPSFNLDLFFTGGDMARSLMAKNSKGSTIAVLEGVMGYYDGLGGSDVTASAYDLSVQTQTPTILVVDASASALSVAALVKGFMDFRPKSNICGVILNRADNSTLSMLKPIIERECAVPVVGCLPKDDTYSLESRHLGLVSAAEVDNLKLKIASLTKAIEANVDMELLIEIARSAPDFNYNPLEVKNICDLDSKPTIALAEDSAFCFYYEENLQMLRDLGANILKFSPMRDKEVPKKADAIYLGGGYPELNAKELSENISMRESMLRACKNKMPIFAECGGFMYLQKELLDLDGNAFEMVGFLDAKASYTGKLTRFGYVNLVCDKDNFLCEKKQVIPAHEFHYYDSTQNGDVFTAQKPIGSKNWKCFVSKGRLLAGFPHLYFPAAGDFAAKFVGAAAKYHALKKDGK